MDEGCVVQPEERAHVGARACRRTVSDADDGRRTHGNVERGPVAPACARARCRASARSGCGTVRPRARAEGPVLEEGDFARRRQEAREGPEGRTRIETTETTETTKAAEAGEGTQGAEGAQAEAAESEGAAQPEGRSPRNAAAIPLGVRLFATSRSPPPSRSSSRPTKGRGCR